MLQESHAIGSIACVGPRYMALGERSSEILFTDGGGNVWRNCLPNADCEAVAINTKMLSGGNDFNGIGVLHEMVSPSEANVVLGETVQSVACSRIPTFPVLNPPLYSRFARAGHVHCDRRKRRHGVRVPP